MATTVENRRETTSLIGSDKVEGTAVYGADKRKIGTVQRLMIDKIRQDCLCCGFVWRILGHWRGLLPNALAEAGL
jgi:hypothetical protein